MYINYDLLDKIKYRKKNLFIIMVMNNFNKGRKLLTCLMKWLSIS